MVFIRTFIIFFIVIAGTAKADMMKCSIKKNHQVILNYFEHTDKKQLKKCITKPIVVVTSSGKKISNRYKNSSTAHQTKKSQAQFEPIAAKDVKPMGCQSKGGTVTINGKTFHLDTSALCKRYSANNKGRISRGRARHVKLGKVAANFRKKIAGFVNRTAQKHGLEPEFIHAVISAESAYNPNATSHVGAMGLMQLMPFTAERFGVSNAYNPHQNIEAGTKYLKLLLDEFGSLELAAAGYNAGEGAVRKYGNNIPPYRETMAYVPKVMAYYRQYKKNRRLIATK